MLPDKAAALAERFERDPRQTVIHAACWDVEGVELPLFRADNGQSSSLMAPETHLYAHPEIAFQQNTVVKTRRLDSLVTGPLDLLNIDIQGAELRAIQGLGERVRELHLIYSEVNEERLYEGCGLVGDIDTYLKPYGFERVATRIAPGVGWGDALYVNAAALYPTERAKLPSRKLRWAAHEAVRNAGLMARRALSPIKRAMLGARG